MEKLRNSEEKNHNPAINRMDKDLEILREWNEEQQKVNPDKKAKDQAKDKALQEKLKELGVKMNERGELVEEGEE